MIAAAGVGTVVSDLAGADLGDQRRTDRLLSIVEALQADPEQSFPRALASDSALEAFYRFINNRKFDAADIVAPHVEATLCRARSAGTVLAIHDTTSLDFATARVDLGPTNIKRNWGFLVHTTLLLSADDGIPLGVCHLETLKRTGSKSRQKHQQSKRVRRADETRESLRWLRGVKELEQARQGQFQVIHVTDAEGDFFELVAELYRSKARFVIRAGQLQRQVMAGTKACSLREALDTIKPTAWRRVELSQRKHPQNPSPSRRKRYPERRAHQARLAIGATRITLHSSHCCPVRAEPFEISVVRVWEREAKPGQPMMEWILLTTEPTSSSQDLERIVDIYRKRWVIEEYFKALKSGCSAEKRQVETYEALRKVLALFIPIAHRLLLLRHMAQRKPKQAASKTFSDAQLTLIAKAPANQKLPRPKTIEDVLDRLARLGGHIRNNGKPGWQTLSHGYEKLLIMQLGWEIAMHEKHKGKCDQS